MPRAARSSSTMTLRSTDKQQRPWSSNPPKASRKRAEPPASADRSSPQPAKRPRRATVEKRQARFVARPTAAVADRIDRAFEHRMYLIERRPAGDLACDFFVLGATGNVYTVRLGLRPSCTCPDFRRGNTCKHILFVMLRVLKLPVDDPRVWQKALLSSELADLLHVSFLNEASVLASDSVRARFREIAERREEKKAVQRDVEGDCPVCYEPLAGGRKEAVVFCRVCGNNVHKDCFVKWSKSKRDGVVTCIYCRAPWEEKEGGKLKGKAEDYVNLAAYSDSHRREDTSLEALYPETSRWIRHR